MIYIYFHFLSININNNSFIYEVKKKFKILWRTLSDPQQGEPIQCPSDKIEGNDWMQFVGQLMSHKFYNTFKCNIWHIKTFLVLQIKIVKYCIQFIANHYQIVKLLRKLEIWKNSSIFWKDWTWFVISDKSVEVIILKKYSWKMSVSDKYWQQTLT